MGRFNRHITFIASPFLDSWPTYDLNFKNCEYQFRYESKELS